jgi:hypothetical protein
MSDHNDNAFRAAIKALGQVVAPAVDPSNPLAVEQLRLVIQFLEMHVDRRQLQGKLDWRELELNVEFGAAVLKEVGAGASAAVQALGRLVAMGEAHLVQPGPAVSERQRLSDDIAAAISALLVERSTQSDGPGGHAVERIVLEHSRRQLDLKRSWFLPFGFESDAKRIPPIAAVLAGCPDV